MKRFLLTLVLFSVVMLALRSLAGLFAYGSRPSRGKVRDASAAARSARAGALVRDRVCNTFLPRDRAIELRDQSSMSARLAPTRDALLNARNDTRLRHMTRFSDRDSAIHHAQRLGNVVA